MKNRKMSRPFSSRTEQRALQQFHQRMLRRALQLARQSGRRNLQ